jgi:hypothetical protein
LVDEDAGMSALVELTMRLRTVSALNAREHWAVRAKRVKRERLATGLALLMVRGSPTLKARARGHLAGDGRLVVELTRLSRGELDDDNLRGALKSVRDEVARWLGVDDRDPRVTWAYGQERARGFGVRIRIEREEAACPTSWMPR